MHQSGAGGSGMKAARFFLIANMLAVPAQAAAQSDESEEYWRIPQDRAECILENLDAYIARPGAIALIAVEDCPNVDPFAGAMKGLKNQSGVMADINTEKTSQKTAKFLSYPKSELRCLKGVNLQVDGDGLVLLPKSVTCGE